MILVAPYIWSISEYSIMANFREWTRTSTTLHAREAEQKINMDGIDSIKDIEEGQRLGELKSRCSMVPIEKVSFGAAVDAGAP